MTTCKKLSVRTVPNDNGVETGVILSYIILMNYLEILCKPIVCGLVMALVTWCILDFWQGILSKPHLRLPREVIKLIIALLNGVMSYMAEVMTENNASPRTIALYMPIMIVLEIHILGHMKTKWGSFSILALTSFQFISMYSVSLGITYLATSQEFVASRWGLVLPVTLLNIFLSIFLLSLKIYKFIARDKDRSIAIGNIISDYKTSLILVLFSVANAIAITILTYNSIDMLRYTEISGVFKDEICHNMIIRDTILFFTSVLMLDLQSRAVISEHKAKDMIAKNILLERDIETQNMIQKGLEAARKNLEEENQKLSTGLEYERRLRNSLHRNILFRFSCNVTKGTIEETGSIHVDAVKSGEITRFDDIVKLFSELLVHPDHRNDLREKMSIDNLASIAYTEKGFSIPMRISPSVFINYVTLDDDSARIYSYVDKDYIWTDLDCTVVLGEGGDTYAYFYVMDIDEQKQKEELIHKAATTDALTGLLNRGAFREKLNDYLSSPGNPSGTLFMFDLDYFKSVNDNLGHPKGDALLRDVAELLNHTFRSDDLVCRIGGDEFCAFAKGFTDKSLIVKRAELLNTKGRKSFSLPDGKQINVSFSIGIAVIPGDAKDASELYKNADTALYRAKESGRDCYKTFSE